jgi:hypothetical protein
VSSACRDEAHRVSHPLPPGLQLLSAFDGLLDRSGQPLGKRPGAVAPLTEKLAEFTEVNGCAKKPILTPMDVPAGLT